MASDWSASNSWIQKTTSADAGKIRSRSRSETAITPRDGYDGEAMALFTISELHLNISGLAYQDKNSNNI